MRTADIYIPIYIYRPSSEQANLTSAADPHPRCATALAFALRVVYSFSTQTKPGQRCTLCGARRRSARPVGHNVGYFGHARRVNPEKGPASRRWFPPRSTITATRTSGALPLLDIEAPPVAKIILLTAVAVAVARHARATNYGGEEQELI